MKPLLPVVVVLGLVSLPLDAAAGRFRYGDRTREVGLNHKSSGTWGSVWVDHDRNGGPDVFIGRHGVNPFMFFNDGTGSDRRRWFDLTHPPGYDSLDGDTWVDGHGCAWGEATGDGRPRRFMSRLTIEIL